MLVDEGFPVLAGDERDDSAGSGGCAAVVFAVFWALSALALFGVCSLLCTPLSDKVVPTCVDVPLT